MFVNLPIFSFFPNAQILYYMLRSITYSLLVNESINKKQSYFIPIKSIETRF